jgi:hypothetical protein
MEQRMESKEWKWGGSVTQSENGHVIRFLATSEQFHARSCARCAGLLVSDWCSDLANTGEHNAELLRCVQCGNRVDPVIVQNHLRLPVANDYVRRTHPELSASMKLPTKAA